MAGANRRIAKRFNPPSRSITVIRCCVIDRTEMIVIIVFDLMEPPEGMPSKTFAIINSAHQPATDRPLYVVLVCGTCVHPSN